ncbi:gluconokinase [Sebaldella sp. S0638]|uniref:gluconokinase n=1 Tax=Sebaldella sp. S0638 TaxID=2957809 RepID=UPI0020A1EC4B|nr:gluconokinase [Sebaldella sp. S0638]MCP1222870.1 gluconokinase [Sebaldella sp. S0638]
MKYLISIDIGTTSAKLIAYSIEGKIISERNSRYNTYTPKDGFFEQNPEEIFESVTEKLKDIISDNKTKVLLGISFSTAMHSIAAIDENDELLTNALLWSDRRSEKLVKKYKESNIIHNIFLKTGTPIHAMSPLFKIMWFREEKKDIFQKTKKFISIKEYIIFKLTGKYYVDYSTASATGLFDIHVREWSREAIDFLGIDEGYLSESVDIDFKIYDIKEEYREFLGLAKDIPFIIGGSDGCMANLGVNDMEEGTAVITLGTSAAVRVGSKNPEVDNGKRIFTYILDKNHYISGGAVNNTGIVLEWLKEKLFPGLDYKEIFQILEDTEDIAGIPVFLPYLLGERAPIWNSNARGVFFGISLEHKQEHFVRAVLEGIIYSIYDVFRVLDSMKDIKKIYINGGLSRSEAFVRTMADVFNREILISENYESSCFGAFITGMAAVEEIENIESFNNIKFEVKKITPDREKHKVYMEKFRIYKEVYNSLKEIF